MVQEGEEEEAGVTFNIFPTATREFLVRSSTITSSPTPMFSLSALSSTFCSVACTSTETTASIAAYLICCGVSFAGSLQFDTWGPLSTVFPAAWSGCSISANTASFGERERAHARERGAGGVV